MNRKHSRTDADEEMITLPSGDRVPLRMLEEDLSGDCYKKADRVIIDKLPTISGSIAGTSSRFFQDYKRHREIEQNRLAQMEKDAVAEEELRVFTEKRDARRRQLEAEAAKKRERRTKRKAGKQKDELGIPAIIMSQIKESERVKRVEQTVVERPVNPLNIVASSNLTIIDEQE